MTIDEAIVGPSEKKRQPLKDKIAQDASAIKEREYQRQWRLANKDRRNAKSKEKPKSEKCHSCAILIGPDFMERVAYAVGKFRICGYCWGELAKHGHIELDGHKPIRGLGTVCRWLYPDGSVKPMRIVSIKYPEPDVQYIPLDTPLPEDLLFGNETVE